jgi:hypothetical protein
MMIVLSVGLIWTNRKISKIVTLYHRELFKNIPCLGTSCTQSVSEGLTGALQNLECLKIQYLVSAFSYIYMCVCVCVCIYVLGGGGAVTP